MLRTRSPLVLLFAALGSSSFASPGFTYDWSDTRTILQDYSGIGSASQGWSGRLTTDVGDSPLYINGLSVATGAGFDPNILYSTPSQLDYYDVHAGASGTYTFGTAIGEDQIWDIRRFLDLDTFEGTLAEQGVYDLSLTILGGADDTAQDELQTFDFHIEVADRIDATTTSTTTPITEGTSVSNVSIGITNNSSHTIVTTTWYYTGAGFQQDPSDPSSPTLTGDFRGNWFDMAIAPGDTLSGAHSDWSLNDSSTVGSYIGTIGVSGGLHYGDDFSFRPTPDPIIDVQAVPEPASMAALAVGALSLRRRRKA